MRAWMPVLALAAACGSDDGAHLTLTLPPGMAPASRLQIVLASADPAMINQIDHQRVAPGQLAEESVVYYQQRATGGVIGGPVDDGFELRITPNPIDYPDDRYVPFVLLYDANDTLVGIATLRMGDDPTPQAIAIQDGEITKYTLAVEGVAAADPAAAIAAGHDLVVTCDGQRGTWTSGITWRPAAGPELRILLPDVDLNANAEDATLRFLDLDCDTVVAKSTDDKECDDVRAAFHRGAQEACDGIDTNCDGALVWAEPCGGAACPSSTTQTGMALCDETTSTKTTCQNDPVCACSGGLAGCTRCVLQNEPNAPAGNVVPCQPAVGKLAAGCDAGSCKAIVVGASNGWKVEVSTQPSGSFGDEASMVGHDLFVRAQLEQGPGTAIPGQGGSYIGEFQIAIKPVNGAARLLQVALQADLDVVTACTMTNGDGVMVCQ